MRDTAWGTTAATLSGVEIEESGAAFRVAYEARCAGPEGTFRYSADIAGGADGALTFAAAGSPDGDFPANRIGFVVLHPPDGVAGEEVEIEHTDGTRETVVLPAAIAPDQPAFDISAIVHRPAPGLLARIVLEGDAYEMEDHRNWTDASFKTYVRPLARPRPFVTRGGEEIAQSVRLLVSGRAAPVPRSAAGPIAVEIGEPEGRMPRIALACDGDEIGEALDAAQLVRDAGINRLAIRYDPGRGHGADVLAGFERLCEALEARLTLEAIIPGVDPGGEWRALRRASGTPVWRSRRSCRSRAATSKPARRTRSRREKPPPRISTVRPAKPFPASPSAGTVANFTELNRNRPPPGLGDFVTHATCAIVHAADDRSVMETLEALPHVFRSTRAFVDPALPYRIGLAAIRADLNPYGPAVAPNPENRRVTMTRADPRQRGTFAAAFALAYAAAAAEHGIAELALGDVAGPLGMVEPRDGETGAGRPRPLLGIAAALAAAEGSVRRATRTSSSVAAIAYETGTGTALHLANRSGETLRVDLPGRIHTALRDGEKRDRSPALWDKQPLAPLRLLGPGAGGSSGCEDQASGSLRSPPRSNCGTSVSVQ